jgi:hypothetical protein
MSAHANASPDAAAPAPVQKKRRRPALACEQCRRRKVRCDRLAPCNHCSKSDAPEQCKYVPIHAPKQKKKKPRVPRSATTRTVSIRPAVAPKPKGSQCSTEIIQSIPGSISASGAVSETGEQLNERPASSIDEGSGDTGEDEGEDAAATSDNISRTRYFGRSHWMTGLGLVSILIPSHECM